MAQTTIELLKELSKIVCGTCNIAISKQMCDSCRVHQIINELMEKAK